MVRDGRKQWWRPKAAGGRTGMERGRGGNDGKMIRGLRLKGTGTLGTKYWGGGQVAGGSHCL